MSDQKKGLEFVKGKNQLFAVLGIQHGEVVWHGKNGSERLGAVYTRQGLNALVGRTAETHGIDLMNEGREFLVREGESLLPSMGAVIELVQTYTPPADMHMAGYAFIMCSCGLHGAFVSGFGGESKPLGWFGEALSVAFAASERNLVTAEIGIVLLKEAITAGLPREKPSFRTIVEQMIARLGTPEAVFGPDGEPTTVEELFRKLEQLGLDVGHRH